MGGGRKLMIFARSLFLVILFALTICPFGSAENPKVSQVLQSSKETKDLNGKVLVVFIYDPHCRYTCDRVRPTVREIQSKFAKSVSYLEIDTAEEHTQQSKALAEKNGVLWFYNDNMKFVPVVGFFSPQRKCIKYLTGPKSRSVYEAALERAMKAK